MNWKRELWPEWQVVGDLGSGAFGKVYKLRRQDMGGTFFAALKVVSVPQNKHQIEQLRRQNMTNEQISEYFERMAMDISKEITVMERFKGNTNIVSYEDHKIVPWTDGIGWDVMIRMELLQSLPDYLEEHSIDEREICKIGIDICRALDFCEKEKIIHRDVKPGNVFVSDFGDYKLGDFSLVKNYEWNMELSTPKGTYSYMAPEVCLGGRFDSTVDTYALGLVLYRLLNRGRGPFQPLPPTGLTPEISEVANQKRLQAETLPKPVDASPEVAAVILKACARKPTRRFQHAKEMQEALQRCNGFQQSGTSKNTFTQYLRKALTVFQDSDERNTVAFSAVNPTEVRGEPTTEIRSRLPGAEQKIQQRPKEVEVRMSPKKKTMSDFFTSAGDL